MTAVSWAPLLDGDPDSRIEWRDLELPGFWALIQPRKPDAANRNSYEYLIFRTRSGALAHRGTALNKDHARRQVRGWERHCLDHPEAAPRP